MPSPAEAAPSVVLVAELPDAGGRLVLPDAESHYLVRVCRARIGDRATATDGRGALAAVRLVSPGPPAMVEVDSCDRATRSRECWVLAGAPEGERGDWMVEKLAELGVSVFQPVECERGGWQRLGRRAERWQRLAVAALRQSRRRFLLEIRSPLALEEALSLLPAGAERWLADASGRPASLESAAARGLSVGLIGPSAGLSTRERLRASESEFVPMCLSDSRLRTETAAMAWASWWAGQGGAGPSGG